MRKNRPSRGWLSFGTWAALSLFGAGRLRAERATSDRLPIEEALRDLAAAECGRADDCGDVGEGCFYPDALQCASDATIRDRAALDPAKCPAVHESALARCTADIRSVDCGSLEARADSLSSCSAKAICAR